MDIQDGFDQEAEALDEALEAGILTRKEYDKAVRDLRYVYQAEAQEAAHEAYEREKERWMH